MKHLYHEDIDYYDGRAHGLLASARDGTESAAAVFARWDAPLTEDGAHLAIAREHGCEDWRALRRRVAELPGSDEAFYRAYRAIEAHDVDGVRAQLDRDPELVAAKGTNDNDLLGMAGATGDERLVRLLLDRGADPASANAHGWTPMHQAAYSDMPQLAELLLAAGAPVDRSARGDGGTPLVVALFWGNRGVAELLADRSLAPGNLRVAAGLGRLEMIEELAGAGGGLSPAAGTHRAYYRPHGGFPDWTRPTTRRRSSTRRSPGRHETTASTPSTHSSPSAPASRPTSTAARHWPGRPRPGGPPPSSAWSRSAPTRAAARRSAGRRTARASRRCTSPLRAATATRRVPCSPPAPTAPRAMRCTTRRRPAGRSTAGTPRWPTFYAARRYGR